MRCASPTTSQPPGFSFSILRCPNLIGDDAWFLNRLRGDGCSLRCIGFACHSCRDKWGHTQSLQAMTTPWPAWGEGCMHMWESSAWKCTVCNGFKHKCGVWWPRTMPMSQSSWYSLLSTASTAAGSMPDSTVINSLLSAVLAHGAGLGTHSCMLSALFSLHHVNLLQ